MIVVQLSTNRMLAVMCGGNVSLSTIWRVGDRWAQQLTAYSKLTVRITPRGLRRG